MNTTNFRKMYTPEEIKAIAGGGGKLYLHQFQLPISYPHVCGNVTFNYYSTINKPLTWEDIKTKGSFWLSLLTYNIPTISNTSNMVGFPCGLVISEFQEGGKWVIKARLTVMLLKSMGTITTKEIILDRVVSDKITEV